MNKKVPLGKPLQLTDEQMEELSKITPQDIQKANERWKNVVDSKISDILEAIE